MCDDCYQMTCCWCEEDVCITCYSKAKKYQIDCDKCDAYLCGLCDDNYDDEYYNYKCKCKDDTII